VNRLKQHAWIYGIGLITGSFLVIALQQYWLFWPLAVWSSAFIIHYLIVKSLTVDEAWVDERTLDTAYNAYDLGHIYEIRKANKRKTRRE